MIIDRKKIAQSIVETLETWNQPGIELAARKRGITVPQLLASAITERVVAFFLIPARQSMTTEELFAEVSALASALCGHKPCTNSPACNVLPESDPATMCNACATYWHATRCATCLDNLQREGSSHD